MKTRKIITTDPAIEKRFWAFVAIGEPDECWLWTGRLADTGYGLFSQSHTESRLAHRMAFALTNGEPAAETPIVRHRCDNRPCCNPAHLQQGTIADNVRDKCERGGQLRGSAHGASVLTEADVLQIKALLVGGETTVTVGAAFGVNKGTIGFIRRGKTWAHVPWPDGSGFPRIGGPRGRFKKGATRKTRARKSAFDQEQAA